MKTVLLTSFGKYGDYPANSSEIVTKTLTGMKKGPGFWAIAENFPADIPRYNRGKHVLDMAKSEEVSPDGIDALISIGMDSSKTGVSIETQATNRIFHPRYVPAELNNTPVDPTLPLDYEFDDDLGPHWDIDKMMLGFHHTGVRLEFSLVTSGFCCNHLMFQMMRLRSTHPKTLDQIPWIFIHIPCTPECVSGPMDVFLKAGKITLTKEQVISSLGIIVGCLRN